MPWRAAGTDSSDGLLEAVQNLCESSNCQAILDLNNLPRDQRWPLGAHWDQWCINGGEDFELILSLPPKWAKALIKAFPSSKTIGLMKSGPPQVIWSDGTEIQKCQSLAFQHF